MISRARSECGGLSLGSPPGDVLAVREGLRRNECSGKISGVERLRVG